MDEVNVDVAQHVEHADGHPAETEGRHHQGDQAEGLALARPLRLGLALRAVARHHAVAQLDRDAEVGGAKRRQREDEGDEEGAVSVRQPVGLLAHPELLADDEALVLELHMVGVSHCRGHQTTGQQPDPRQQVGTRQHRDALLQRVHSGIVSEAKGKRQREMVLKYNATCMYCSQMFCV